MQEINEALHKNNIPYRRKVQETQAADIQFNLDLATNETDTAKNKIDIPKRTLPEQISDLYLLTLEAVLADGTKRQKASH